MVFTGCVASMSTLFTVSERSQELEYALAASPCTRHPTHHLLPFRELYNRTNCNGLIPEVRPKTHPPKVISTPPSREKQGSSALRCRRVGETAPRQQDVYELLTKRLDVVKELIVGMLRGK